MWRWEQQEPFGSNPADQNPSGLGVFDLPLRFAGQRYDVETGLHYNYYRNFDSSIGGYKESDLIGLQGGLNTYAYVAASPLSRIDPLGLDWLYSQGSGALYYIDPQLNSTYVASGYSGTGPGFNNPAMQAVPNVGPIPQGIFNIGPQQTNVTSTGVQLPGSMRLAPQPGTIAAPNRSGFLIHGGSFTSFTSSAGCIVLPPRIRNLIGSSGDPILIVIP